MEVISCLVPELQSGRGRQLFEKTLRCYVSPYTIMLCEIDKCSCKKAARNLKAAKDSSDDA